MKSSGTRMLLPGLCIVGAALLVTGCTAALDLKAIVKEQVVLSKVALVLYDGTERVAAWRHCRV